MNNESKNNESKKAELSRTIGMRINTLLGVRNVKQKELAAVLGVTDNTISYFVGGKRIPNTEQLKVISEFFNVSADYLLGLSDADTDDKDLQFACDYTGLSDESVKGLHESRNLPIGKSVIPIIDQLLGYSFSEFFAFCGHCNNYYQFNQEYIEKIKENEKYLNEDISNDEFYKLLKECQDIKDKRDLNRLRAQEDIIKLLENYIRETDIINAKNIKDTDFYREQEFEEWLKKKEVKFKFQGLKEKVSTKQKEGDQNGGNSKA